MLTQTAFATVYGREECQLECHFGHTHDRKAARIDKEAKCTCYRDEKLGWAVNQVNNTLVPLASSILVMTHCGRYVLTDANRSKTCASSILKARRLYKRFTECKEALILTHFRHNWQVLYTSEETLRTTSCDDSSTSSTTKRSHYPILHKVSKSLSTKTYNLLYE